MPSSSATSIKWLVRLSAASAFVLIAVAALVLLGWSVGSETLKRIVPGFVAMNPVTAVAFVLAGISLLSLLGLRSSKARAGVGSACALAIAVLGSLKLVQYTTGVSFGVDTFLFSSELSGNQIAPDTAFNFFLIGLALLLVRLRPRDAFVLSQVLTTIVGIVAFFTLVGYGYGAENMYQVATFIPMAVHTGALFMTAAIGLVFASPDRGIMGIVMSPRAGGVLARRLIPAAIALPVLLGWLQLRGERLGLFDGAFGIALMAAMNVLLFFLCVGRSAAMLNRMDSARATAEEQLKAEHAELDRRVRERTAELGRTNEALNTEIRRQADTLQALAESENRFQSFMDNSPLVGFIKDAEGKYVYGNRLLTETLGRDDWSGKTDHDVFPEEVATVVRQHDLDVLSAKRPLEFTETVCSPNGEHRNWLVYRFPLDLQSDQTLLGGVALDITDRKRTEEALQQKNEQLRQSQKMEALGTLAGGVAHEFNNLLQVIQGYTGFVLEELQAEDSRRQDLQQVMTAADRAKMLTRQLLGFGRRQMLQFTNVDVNVLVRDSLKMLRPLIGEHIEVEMTLDTDIGEVHADAGHLQQMLMNLCVNARDAMPNGGQLFIRTAPASVDREYCEFHPDIAPGNYLVLTVADTGTGMTPEVKQHIFEPFFTTKEVGKGTGLGLSMVYGLVQQHNGTIRVYSEVGSGTTFKVYLPTTTQIATSEGAAAPLPARGGRETILIAEDEPGVRDLAVRMLSKAGYKTLAAQDGEQALQLFAEHSDEIDLALLDVIMPKCGGHEVYSRIKRSKPDFRALFCSGYDPETAQVGFVVKTGVRLLQKPYDPSVLLGAVREILDERLQCQPG